MVDGWRKVGSKRLNRRIEMVGMIEVGCDWRVCVRGGETVVGYRWWIEFRCN